MRLLWLIAIFLVSCHTAEKEPSHSHPQNLKPQNAPQEVTIFKDHQKIKIQVINGTFLGNFQRNYYGEGIPNRWNLIWKTWLGSGKTIVKKGKAEWWAGAGWTGQPLLFLENNHPFLLQGAYDYHLKKIDALNGKILWQYPFEDVIKGTGTIWLNHHTHIPELKAVVIQGSRQSPNYHKPQAPALKAISLLTGQCVWELNVEKTPSYSRDADASALIVNDTAYIGLENGYFYTFLPDPRQAKYQHHLVQPKILKKVKVYREQDIRQHAGNLVIEASPAYWNRKIFLSAGSGHVIAYDLNRKKIEWDLFIGSDLDGTPVITPDSCILIPIEKQYIKGKGGLLKFNPRTKQIEWFFPTENRSFAGWKGGVIGSAAVQDSLCAINAIDGYTYVVHLYTTEASPTLLFDQQTQVPKPKLVFRYRTGPSISTPLLIENHLITAGYHGIHIFQRTAHQFRLIKKIPGRFEATPFIYQKRMYIASRDGYLYCFGE